MRNVHVPLFMLLFIFLQSKETSRRMSMLMCMWALEVKQTFLVAGLRLQHSM